MEAPGCGGPWLWRPLVVEAPGCGGPWLWRPLGSRPACPVLNPALFNTAFSSIHFCNRLFKVVVHSFEMQHNNIIGR